MRETAGHLPLVIVKMYNVPAMSLCPFTSKENYFVGERTYLRVLSTGKCLSRAKCFMSLGVVSNP